jgi:anti-sigma B factor antagonist
MQNPTSEPPGGRENSFVLTDFFYTGERLRREFKVVSKDSSQISKTNFYDQLEQSGKVKFTVVKISEPLTVYSSELLRNVLIKHLELEVPKYVIDLSDLDQINSSGIGALFALVPPLRRRKDFKLIIFGMQPEVEQLFKMTKLIEFFTSTQNFEEALAF